jgi:hypothetical protein
MGAIVGLDGKPIKSKQQVNEKVNNTVEKVQCQVLVGDLDTFTKTKPFPIKTPEGTVRVPPEQVVSSIAFNLYSLMQMTGQREMIIRMNDNSSDLAVDKALELSLLQIPKKEEQKKKVDEDEVSND